MSTENRFAKSFIGIVFALNVYAADAKEVYSLKDVILKKHNSYYTIVLATVLPSQNYQKIITDNNIGYNAVAYHFGQKDKYVKVILEHIKAMKRHLIL